MNNTTRTEDNIIAKCEDFGGIAAECADICERLDKMISDRDETIADLQQALQTK